MKKFLLLFAGITFMPFMLCFSQNIAFDSLDINNINARINCNGNLFRDLVNSIAKFEVPKGSGKNSIFCSALWIGGIDIHGQLVVAAERYNQEGHDFFPGPFSIIYDSAYDTRWNKTWKILKSDIDYHKTHWGQAGYVIPQSVVNWPAHGDITMGQSNIIAPFFDNNGDGIYNPSSGDYPRIKGDMAIFFVFNDDRLSHSESHGMKLNIEIKAMAYAFACNKDSALWNTVFVNYEITNRSTLKYTNTYLGVWTDIDLGVPDDDYIGCDVQRGSFYGYNGKDVDGSGEPKAYGAYPPAQSVTVLGGTYMDSDGLDNPKYDQNGLQACNESINGVNFGDNIIDNERHGMSKFVYYNNGMGSQGEPDISIDYYNYLRGCWLNGTAMQWGGSGHAPGSGVCGPVCNFMFPGNSDTCHWGTGGQIPGCTPLWTEQIIGNQPADRRGIASVGPFTFNPGATHELDIAYVFGRDYNDSSAWAGVKTMQERIDSIRKYFFNNYSPCGSGLSDTTNIMETEIKIYPNPTSLYLNIDLPNSVISAHLTIHNILGAEIISKTFTGNKTQIDVSKLRKGLYLLKIESDEGVAVRRFMKE